MKSYKKQMKNKSKRRKQKRMTKKRGGFLELFGIKSSNPVDDNLEKLKKDAVEARKVAEEAKKKAEAAEKALQEAEKNPVSGSNPEATNKQATMI
jgi:hypothetical protein